MSDHQQIKYGSRGDDVKLLQTMLGGLTADGIFGKKTKAAVIAYQTANELKVDGIVGPKTWAALEGIEIVEPVFVQPPDFKQYDSRWGSKMYSSCNNKSQTLKSSACGPTSGADIVAQWWDDTVTPVEMCELSLEWGCRTKSDGTTGSFFTKLAAKYGASKYVRTSNIATAISCLETGGYVVVCFGPSKWTSGGHYCVMWKNKDGVFYINDPASANANRAQGTKAEVQSARKGFYCFWK